MVIVEGEAQLENLSERGYRRDKRIQVTRGDIIYIAPGSQLCFFECQRDILAYRTFSYEHGPDHSLRNTTDLMQPVTGKLKVQKKGRAKYLVVDEDAEIFDVETEMDGICWDNYRWEGKKIFFPENYRESNIIGMFHLFDSSKTNF